MDLDIDSYCSRRIDEIRQQAQRDVRGVEFFYDLIKENSQRYLSVFGENCSPEELFKKVSETLGVIERECLPHCGIDSYDVLQRPRTFEILGWGKIVPNFEGAVVGGLRPTSEGKQIVERYRAARGLACLADQAEAMREKIGFSCDIVER